MVKTKWRRPFENRTQNCPNNDRSKTGRSLFGGLLYVLFVFLCFYSFVSSGVSVKKENPLIVNVNDTKLRNTGKKIS
jgi:hypothetical protein